MPALPAGPRRELCYALDVIAATLRVQDDLPRITDLIRPGSIVDDALRAVLGSTTSDLPSWQVLQVLGKSTALRRIDAARARLEPVHDNA